MFTGLISVLLHRLKQQISLSIHQNSCVTTSRNVNASNDSRLMAAQNVWSRKLLILTQVHLVFNPLPLHSANAHINSQQQQQQQIIRYIAIVFHDKYRRKFANISKTIERLKNSIRLNRLL